VKNKGFTIDRNITSNSSYHIVYSVVSLENESRDYINIVKFMKLWYATFEEAYERAEEIAEQTNSQMAVADENRVTRKRRMPTGWYNEYSRV
jgi:hypothetical protein